MAYATITAPAANENSFPTWTELIERYTKRRDNTYQNVLLEAVAALATMTNLDLHLGDVYSE